MNRRIAHTAQIAAFVLALVLVPIALAAKGGGQAGGGKNGGTSSITLHSPLVYDANGNGLPNHGDMVVFDVSTTATTQPFVNLQCFQNGVMIANGWAGYFDGALNTSRNFGLNAAGWQGAADCTAWLDMSTRQGWRQLASTSFHVDP
jgi:hypothetical protein